MRKKLIAGVVASAAIAGLVLSSTPAIAGTSIAGSGSSFANNAMQTCLSYWNPSNGDAATYTSTGSGQGRSNFTGGTSAWAMSDAPLTAGGSAVNHWVNVPLVAGPIVFAYNKSAGKIPAGLKLDSYAISRILKGKITKWNAPYLVALNKGKKLPNHTINLYYRAGTSGTNQNLSEYLRQTQGGTASGWTSNQNLTTAAGGTLATGAVSKTTSQFIASAVEDDAYGFGYFDLSDAASANVNRAYLKNRKGQFVLPSAAAAAKFVAAQPAVKNVSNEAVDGTVTLNFNANVAGAYQLTIFSYGLAPRSTNTGSAGTTNNATIKTWFNYILNSCMPSRAAKLGYVPLTGALKTAAQAQINAIN
jgi:phosphate transport system substrate-binding protein